MQGGARKKAIKRCFIVLLVFVIAVCLPAPMASAEKQEDPNHQHLLQEVLVSQTLSSNNPNIKVAISNSYVITAGRYRYDVYVNTYAGNLGIVGGTRFDSLVIKTNSGGPILKTFFSKSYPFSGSSYHSELIGSFYRSTNDPITSVYIISTGACVYDYQNGWVPADDFVGPYLLDTTASVLVDR